MRVSNNALVPQLDADLLDGLHARSSQTAGTVVRASSPTFTPSEGPINRRARAYCNPGEHAVGGGGGVTALTSDRLGEYHTFLNASVPVDATGEAISVGGGQATGWEVEATNAANHLSGPTGVSARAGSGSAPSQWRGRPPGRPG